MTDNTSSPEPEPRCVRCGRAHSDVPGVWFVDMDASVGVYYVCPEDQTPEEDVQGVKVEGIAR